MAEINARQLLDANGEVYFPFTHATCVEGIPDDISDFDIGTVKEDVSNVQTDVSSLQSQIRSLQSAIANIPTVTDTGWINISLASGVESYSSGNTPQARMMVINEVAYLSLRGAVKGVTTSSGTTVGTIPSSMTSKINSSLYYVQNTTTVSSKLNYTRMMLSTSGVLTIQGSTIESPTATQWYPIHQTFML